jgi:hypothetical protein
MTNLLNPGGGRTHVAGFLIRRYELAGCDEQPFGWLHPLLYLAEEWQSFT